MKDFAVRLYDKKTKEMIIITEFSLENVYKLKELMSEGEPMVGTPYCDKNGDRLFENDIVVHEGSDGIGVYDIIQLDQYKGWVLYDTLCDTK